MQYVKYAIAVVCFAISAMAFAADQPCFGPGPCGPVDPVPSTPPAIASAPAFMPADLGGHPVSYDRFSVDAGETFAKAMSRVQGIYPVVGTAGPCPVGEACPGLEIQAYRDMEREAYTVNRARRLP